MTDTRLSPHFSLRELTASSRYPQVPNEPPAAALAWLQVLCRQVLEPTRRAWGAPLYVTSGYRCAQLNQLVGGVADSQHLLGQAADITTGDLDRNRQLLGVILAHAPEIAFDQCIAEQCDDRGRPRWIHISAGPRHRNMVCFLRRS